MEDKNLMHILMEDENRMRLAREIAMEKLGGVIEKKVNEEYQLLCYQSELVKADGEMMREIESLYKDSLKVRPKGFCDAMGISSMRDKIRGFLNSGNYHPMELKRFKYTIIERLSRS